jgi:hypothetical protein
VNVSLEDNKYLSRERCTGLRSLCRQALAVSSGCLLHAPNITQLPSPLLCLEIAQYDTADITRSPPIVYTPLFYHLRQVSATLTTACFVDYSTRWVAMPSKDYTVRASLRLSTKRSKHRRPLRCRLSSHKLLCQPRCLARYDYASHIH